MILIMKSWNSPCVRLDVNDCVIILVDSQLGYTNPHAPRYTNPHAPCLLTLCPVSLHYLTLPLLHIQIPYKETLHSSTSMPDIKSMNIDKMAHMALSEC